MTAQTITVPAGQHHARAARLQRMLDRQARAAIRRRREQIGAREARAEMYGAGRHFR